MLGNNLKSECYALLGGGASSADASRRTALKAALGLGYAAAAGPLVAQTAIKTSSDGLTAGEVTIMANGFKMPAYRAAPAGKTDLPVVLVIHEVFGVHEYIADTARRWAQAGYLAIAPELFARQGDPTEYGELARLMSEVVAKVPDAQVMGDLDAAVRWAAVNGGDAGKVGISGFCWGGRITWLFAAHSPAVKAGVAWYGRLGGDKTPVTPANPLDVGGQCRGPVLGLYGGADPGIPLADVDRMKAVLASGNAAAKSSSIVVYPDTPHAFHADYRPSYREGPAQDGWKRALAWFKAHGVA
ncbi:dienelactone hydrolase family protein [soil metagenome]